MSNLTDDEKANLSPEELAAIEGDEDSRAELEEVAGDESEEAEDKGEDEDEGEASESSEGDDNDKGAAAKAEASGDDKGKKDGEGKGADGESEDEAATDESASEGFTPRMVAEDVSKLNEQLTAFADQKKALDADFENGDLKHAEYMAKRDELSGQETNVRLHISQAQFAENQNKSTAEQRWEWEQDRFFEDNSIYLQDTLMHAALDASVKLLANAKDDAGKLVNGGKNLTWFLNEAHRQVSRRFKLEVAPTDKEGDGDKDKSKGADAQAQDKGKPKSRAGTKPDLKGIPKTIGNLPAAEDSDAAASEFAAIDKLTGMEYEEALAKMTPEQQERYAKAS
mgnify:CR=1 FL=1